MRSTKHFSKMAAYAMHVLINIKLWKKHYEKHIFHDDQKKITSNKSNKKNKLIKSELNGSLLHINYNLTTITEHFSS